MCVWGGWGGGGSVGSGGPSTSVAVMTASAPEVGQKHVVCVWEGGGASTFPTLLYTWKRYFRSRFGAAANYAHSSFTGSSLRPN